MSDIGPQIENAIKTNPGLMAEFRSADSAVMSLERAYAARKSTDIYAALLEARQARDALMNALTGVNK